MSRVGLVFGGRTVEHEVSVASARTIARGLREAGHEVVPLGVGPDGGWLALEVGREALEGGARRLPAGGNPVAPTLRHILDAGLDVVFPTIHGTWGEDGTLQGLFEMLDLPYVGTDVEASAVAMNKVLCKTVLAGQGLPVVESVVARPGDLEDEDDLRRRVEPLGMPVFVKPARGGSSVGVERVEEPGAVTDALRRGFRFDDLILIERAVVGRELEVAVLGGDDPKASVVGEIVPGVDFYDYEDKYVNDAARLDAPARLDESLAERLRSMAIEAFRAIGGWGMARVDFLVEGGEEPFVNEINTLPGFTDISMYPRLWRESGVSLAALVDRLVQLALQRSARRRERGEAIAAWIASLASSEQ